jgi:hypothetical protein
VRADAVPTRDDLSRDLREAALVGRLALEPARREEEDRTHVGLVERVEERARVADVAPVMMRPSRRFDETESRLATNGAIGAVGAVGAVGAMGAIGALGVAVSSEASRDEALEAVRSVTSATSPVGARPSLVDALGARLGGRVAAWVSSAVAAPEASAITPPTTDAMRRTDERADMGAIVASHARLDPIRGDAPKTGRRDPARSTRPSCLVSPS